MTLIKDNFEFCGRSTTEKGDTLARPLGSPETSRQNRPGVLDIMQIGHRRLQVSAFSFEPIARAVIAMIFELQTHRSRMSTFSEI